jgi:pimeloyl-ACP methyl ester carboxylesterase
MTQPPPYHEHFVRSRDGLSLYCRDYAASNVSASTPVVLCLPGLTRNCRDFEALATALSARHRVLTPDLRGRGRSDYDPDPRNYQPAKYADDVLVMLDRLGVTSVIVIGTSLGGLIAMLLAAMRPTVLAGIVLNDVGPEVAAAGLARIASYVGKLPPVLSWEDAAAQARTVNGVALPDFTDADWMRFARCAYRDDAAGRPVLDMDLKIGDALRAPQGAAPDLWPLFGMLKNIPTLLIRGEHSDILAMTTVERMRSIKPELQFLSVANRGHAPTLDEPPCRAAIQAFIEQHSAPVP